MLLILKGTMGAGKSTIVRDDILARLETVVVTESIQGKKWRIGHHFRSDVPDKNVFVFGRYSEDSTWGGADQFFGPNGLHDPTETVIGLLERICREHRHGLVVFESVKALGWKQTILDLKKIAPVRVIQLTTSVEQCIESVKQRRAASKRPTEPVTAKTIEGIKEYHDRSYKTSKWLTEQGVPVSFLTREEASVEVRKLTKYDSKMDNASIQTKTTKRKAGETNVSDLVQAWKEYCTADTARTNSLWRMGDLLIGLCGAPGASGVQNGAEAKLRNAQEALEANGYTRGLDFLQQLRRTAHVFPAPKRLGGVEWSSHLYASNPETLHAAAKAAKKMDCALTVEFVKEFKAKEKANRPRTFDNDNGKSVVAFEGAVDLLDDHSRVVEDFRKMAEKHRTRWKSKQIDALAKKAVNISKQWADVAAWLQSDETSMQQAAE
jgi:hypothetical protein